MHVLLFLFILFVNIRSNPVTNEMAEIVALRQLEMAQIGGQSNDLTVPKKPDILYDPKNGLRLAYVFHLNPGFILVATDTNLPPVLGYSFNNKFSLDFDFQPTNILINRFKNMYQAIPVTNQETLKRNSGKWRKYLNGEIISDFATMEIYGPLLDTQWHQHSPYNNYCPIDPETGDKCIVGCTATSMAQILNYYQWPFSVSFADSESYWSTYTIPSIWIDATSAYIAYIDYNGAGIHPSDDMKGRLSYAAGVSVEMDYSSTRSGAFFYPYQYINKWGYEYCRMIESSSDSFYTDLLTSIIFGNPAHTSVAIIDSHVVLERHAIVIDGYNSTTDKYHTNFGWGGTDDGWYVLPAGLPASYNTIESAVVDFTRPSGLRIEHQTPSIIPFCPGVSPNPFTIYVIVTNLDTTVANDVEITLNFIDTLLTIVDGDNPLNLGNIEGYGSEVLAYWTVNIISSAYGTIQDYILILSNLDGVVMEDTFSIDIPANTGYDINASATYPIICSGNCTQILSQVEPHFDDWENDFELNGGEITHFGTSDSWQWGIPSYGPDETHSGIKCWATNLGSTYNNNEFSQLITQGYNLTSCSSAELSFWHWYNTETFFDGCQVYIGYSETGPWTLLDMSGYSEPSTVGPLAGQYCYRGSSSGWDYQSIEISSYIGGTKYFKFLFASDESSVFPGWYIDDLKLTVDEYYRYYWTPSCGLSDTLIANPIACPTVTTVFTVYSYDVRNPEECWDTTSILITVNECEHNCSLVVTPIEPICCGDSAYVNVSIGGHCPCEVLDVSWLPQDNLSDPCSLYTWANPTTTTDYSITVMMNCGEGVFSINKTITVTLIDWDLTIIPGDTTIMLGDTIYLSTSISSDCGPYNYRWSPFEGLFAGLVDIVFVLDTTGSMFSCIANVRANLVSFLNSLDTGGYDYAMGLVTFGDGTNFPHGYDLTMDRDTILSWLYSLGSSGGGDWEETSLDGIYDAISLYNWREGATSIIIMITDAPFHEYGDGTTFSDVIPAEVNDSLISSGTLCFISSPFTTGYPTIPTYDYDWYFALCLNTGGLWYLLGTSFSNVYTDILTILTNALSPNPIAIPQITTRYLVYISDSTNPGLCNDSAFLTITVEGVLTVTAFDSIAGEPCWIPDTVEHRGDYSFLRLPGFIKLINNCNDTLQIGLFVNDSNTYWKLSTLVGDTSGVLFPEIPPYYDTLCYYDCYSLSAIFSAEEPAESLFDNPMNYIQPDSINWTSPMLFGGMPYIVPHDSTFLWLRIDTPPYYSIRSEAIRLLISHRIFSSD